MDRAMRRSRLPETTLVPMQFFTCLIRPLSIHAFPERVRRESTALDRREKNNRGSRLGDPRRDSWEREREREMHARV